MRNVQGDQDAAGLIPCVIYGAKSTEDTHGSIPTQTTECADAIKSAGGREVIDTFTDENKSAYSGNRGDGLASAKQLAVALAEKHGNAELWVQHSDRLARGDWLTADHLAEIYFAMRRANVRLRSVQDDSNLEDVIRVALIGERNTEDSRRKSEAVKSGKRRAFERGDLGGGGIPDGLMNADEGRVPRVIRLDPERAPIIRKMFALAEEDLGDATIARELNRAGYRTRGRADSGPKAWYRRRVQDSLTNPVYAGAVVWRRGQPDQEINWDTDKIPAIVDRGTFERLLAERAKRDKAVGSNRNPKGRPATNHALAGLAVCAGCGEVMRPITSTYKRKSDGGRARKYRCRNNETGLCECSEIDAVMLDSHVIADLDRYLGNVEDWRARFLSDHEAERVGLERKAEEARAEVARTERIIAALEAKVEQLVADGDHAKADAALDIVTKRGPDLTRAQRRLAAIEDAVAQVPTDAPTDAMLDFYNSLSDALRGRLDRAGRDSMARVNEALRDIFERFVIDPNPPDDNIAVMPVLRGGRFEAPQTLFSIVSGIEEPPPLRQLDAPSREMTKVHE